MRFRLVWRIGDLHFEMHADGGARLIRELGPTGVDVLVLAGDITMARHYANLESVFKPLAKKYRHILYVPGNHEYYKSSPAEVARNLAKLTRTLPQVVMPENRADDFVARASTELTTTPRFSRRSLSPVFRGWRRKRGKIGSINRFWRGRAKWAGR
jgi:hypothetical protein